MIAHNPLHGSGQAGFPHPALALGDDAHTAQGIGMTDGRRRQPASDQAPHTIPEDPAVLAAPHQRTVPEASYLEPEQPQRRCVHGHSVVPNVSTHHRSQPFAHFGDGIVQSSLQFKPDAVHASYTVTDQNSTGRNPGRQMQLGAVLSHQEVSIT
jgi:hypothetical protein